MRKRPCLGLLLFRTTNLMLLRLLRSYSMHSSEGLEEVAVVDNSTG